MASMKGNVLPGESQPLKVAAHGPDAQNSLDPNMSPQRYPPMCGFKWFSSHLQNYDQGKGEQI